tara:strand:+ start:410 stop:601 length:192 start_codon:yes stop_codon:yes gene_type:complete
VLEEMATDNVTVTVAETGMPLVEVFITQKLLVQMVDAVIPYVLVEFIDVVLENVLDVEDVLHM